MGVDKSVLLLNKKLSNLEYVLLRSNTRTLKIENGNIEKQRGELKVKFRQKCVCYKKLN